MARYATNRNGWTPIAHADSASSLANASYHAVRTTAATTIQLKEVIVVGEAPSSSTVNEMRIRRLSTNGATPTNVAPGPLNPLSAAAVSQFYSAASTGPTIAATAHLLVPGINAFGGIFRWVPDPGGEIWATASTAPNGELVLDSLSGTGVVSTAIEFEEL